MQNMAAIQFVFKINSKLHTQVGQDTNESVDNGLHANFLPGRMMKETILQYQFLLTARQGSVLSMHTESSIKEVHVNV